MTIRENGAEELELENAIDSFGLREVVQALARIAYAKAEHLQVNWQDSVASRAWGRDGQKLDKIAARLEN